MAGDEGYADSSDYVSENDEEEMMCQTPADAFLTGKAVKSEIKLKGLGAEDRKKFDASVAKEWDSWQKFSAVEKLDEEIIIGTRWVHTDKNAKPRLLANYLRKRAGKTESQIERDYPFEAKSRLVVQGCQEESRNTRSDSPTASLLLFNLVCCIAQLPTYKAKA